MIVHVGGLVPSPLSVVDRATYARGAHHTVWIGVLGTGAAIHVDDTATARRLRARYHELRAPAVRMLHAYAVRDDIGRRHFWIGAQAALMWPEEGLSAPDTAFLADALTTHALLGSIPATISLRAAALRCGDAAFAIVGASTAGKSTTALACVAAGCELYSDDRCVVRGGRVIPYPRAVDVRAEGVDLLLDDLPADSALHARLAAHRGSDWEDASFEALLGQARLPAAAPLQAIFAITGLASQVRSRRIAATEMLALASPGAELATHGIDRVRVLLELFAHVPCYELVLGTPSATAREVMALVDRAP